MNRGTGIFRRQAPRDPEREEVPTDAGPVPEGAGNWLADRDDARRTKRHPARSDHGFRERSRALETAELVAIHCVLELVGVEFVEDGDGLRARLRR